jgi:hypothetical protein
VFTSGEFALAVVPEPLSVPVPMLVPPLLHEPVGIGPHRKKVARVGGHARDHRICRADDPPLQPDRGLTATVGEVEGHQQVARGPVQCDRAGRACGERRGGLLVDLEVDVRRAE